VKRFVLILAVQKNERIDNSLTSDGSVVPRWHGPEPFWFKAEVRCLP